VNKNRLKFWKNWWFGSVRFRFYKPETKKIEQKPKPNRKITESTWKTEPNRFEPIFVLKNRTEIGWFEPVSVQFFFNLVWLLSFYKNQTESKMITPDIICILSYKLYCRSKLFSLYDMYLYFSSRSFSLDNHTIESNQVNFAIK